MTDKLTYEELENKIQELEKRAIFFQLIADNTFDWELFTDKFGKILYVNNSFDRITGFNKDEILTGLISEKDYVHPDDLENVNHEIQQLINKKTIADFEFRIITKDKALRNVHCCAQPVYKNIEFIGIRISIRDITERKKAAMELQKAKEKAEENEGKFRNTIEYSPIPTAIAKNDGELIFVNKQFVNTYGYTLHEIPSIGKWFELAYPDIEYRNFVLNDWSKEIENSIKNNIPVNVKEYLVTCKNGDIKTVAVSAYFEKDISIGLFQDITERKLAEIELIKAKEKAEESERNYKTQFNLFQALIRYLPIPFFYKDKLGKYLGCNPAFEKFTGDKENEIIGKTVFDVFETELAKTYHEKDLELINHGISQNYEFFVSNSNKILRNVIFNKAVFFDEHANTNGIIGTFFDITEQKIIEQELNKAKEKAEESDRLKTAFLQNMSHEIRTPLNAISGFSGMLNKPELSEEKRKSFVSIIQNSSQQLISIVTDILTISSLETKQEKINFNKVCINNIIVELLSVFKQQAANQNISLFAKQQLKDKQSEIFTDKTKVTQILTNLIANALKFTHEGFVEFGYNLKENELEFYVKDSGIGIKPELREKVFERFRQADKSIQLNYGGTGLGLSISKAFVELLRGKIWVQSEPTKGSTFYFTIPYKPVAEIDKITSPTKQNENFRTVLVAEDEEFNFLLIEEYLSTMDLKLIHAKDGNETVEICKENPNIGLILMDIKMPIMTGDTAAKLLKDFRPDIRIIAQSGYALETEIEKYSGIFDDYLTKPINENDLKKIVMKYIDIKKE